MLNHVQLHKVSSGPVLTWPLPLRDESVCLSCEVCSAPLAPHVQHLCCALALCWGEIKMLSLGISLPWSFLSPLLVWRSSAQSTAPPLCTASSHTVQHETGLCGQGGSRWNTGSYVKQKYRCSDRICDKLHDYYLMLPVFAVVVLLYVQYIFHH